MHRIIFNNVVLVYDRTFFLDYIYYTGSSEFKLSYSELVELQNLELASGVF